MGDLGSGRRPLVTLHGGPGMSHHYMLPHAQMHELYGVPVVFYDQLGIGLSTHLRDKPTAFWTVDVFMDELDNLLAHLGIRGDFDLLGNSWGAMLAGHYAAVRRPAGMKHVVVANGGASMALWEAGTRQLLERLPYEVRTAIERGEREGRRDTDAYKAAMKVFQMKHICKVDPWPRELLTSFAATDEDPTVYATMYVSIARTKLPSYTSSLGSGLLSSTSAVHSGLGRLWMTSGISARQRFSSTHMTTRRRTWD